MRALRLPLMAVVVLIDQRFSFEDTLDGTNWNPVAAFAQRVGVGREVVNVTAPFSDRLRVRWTVGGTAPSFTFTSISAVTATDQVQQQS